MQQIKGIIKKQKSCFEADCRIFNKEKLATKHNINTDNDKELLLKLIKKQGINKTLQEIDGVYAFCLAEKDKITIARDIIGVKPLWFSIDNNTFSFASDKKDLKNCKNIQELNPREIIEYNLKTNKTKTTKRKFFQIKPELKLIKNKIIKELTGLLTNAISKRIPNKKFGILFSGGIDSTLIAFIAKQLGLNPICYTSALKQKGMSEAEDLKQAKYVAKKLKLKLKTKTINIEQAEKYLKKIIPIIDTPNVVKAGVALTLFPALELAKKDNTNVIFTGLGSEELFAGYQRHKNASDINKECCSGLLQIYERDLSRDNSIALYNNIELMLPFLDKPLTEFSLKIPSKLKQNNKQQKIIIREVAKSLGIPEDIAETKKRAAQYGSKFDRAIAKLAKKDNNKSKSEYLSKFYNKPNLKLASLFSSGKDSCYAMYLMQKQGYKISCLITMQSKNPDSYMWHTPTINIAQLQARAMNIPILIQQTKGQKELELKDLEKALIIAKDQYQIKGIVTGALYSKYQKDRIEKVCNKLNLKVFSPLWHIDQEKEMREILKNNFKFIITKIAAEGLNKSWLNKTITEKDIDKLVELNKKIGFNIAFEGGEAESLMIDGPIFNKKIQIKQTNIIEESEISATLEIKKAELKDK